jgi:hypothetical protein
VQKKQTLIGSVAPPVIGNQSGRCGAPHGHQWSDVAWTVRNNGMDCKMSVMRSKKFRLQNRNDVTDVI